MQHILTILSFSVAYLLINLIIFYQVNNIQPTIWNLTKYNFIMLPILLFANILITMTFNRAFSSIGRMWPVTIMCWGAQVIVIAVLTIVFFKEVPNRNVLIGLALTISGILIANYK